MLITSEYVQSGGRGRFYILFMIRLTTCTNKFNAQLLKGALESEGISAMFSNEIMSGFWGTPGVDSLFKAEGLEAARRFWSSRRNKKSRKNFLLSTFYFAIASKGESLKAKGESLLPLVF